MSAFILSDKHFTIISNYVNLIKDNINMQDFANKLKSINIKSVNYRYNEKTRITKCKLDYPKVGENYSKYDVIRLIQCWSYQSCEDGSNIDYLMMDAFLFSFFDNDEIQKASLESKIWNI